MLMYWFVKIQRWLTIALAIVIAFLGYFVFGISILGLDSVLAVAFGILGFVVVGLSALVARRASSKGKSAVAFFFLSLLISPLITWLIVESLSDPELVSQEEPEKGLDFKLCPYCAEEVRAQAIKCKHCGSAI